MTQQNNNEEELSDSQQDENPRTGLWGRMRSGLGSARDRAVGTADTITGIQFRRQFEDFTEAVTTAVVGVHRDQGDLKERVDQIGNEVVNTQQEQSELRNKVDQLDATVGNTQQEQLDLRNRVDQLDTSGSKIQQGLEGLEGKTAQLQEKQKAILPRPAVIAIGLMSALALAFSIAAFVRTF